MGLDALLVLVAFASLWLGYSVGITLGGVALGFACIAWAFGAFDGALLLAVPSRIFGIMTNSVLLAIPMFVFMGLVIERAGLAEDMFAALHRSLGQKRGGLTVSVTLVGALLAASTGIVGASVVTLGLLALPALIRRGAEPGYAGASVAAAGTLGQIIPPAIVLIVLSDQISNAWQQVQLEQGNFAPQSVSVADLFAAALLPGLALSGMIVVYQWFRGGDDGTDVAVGDDTSVPPIVMAFLGPVFLIALVLGSILGGVATATEASAFGAVGALLLADQKTANSRSKIWPALGIVALLGLLSLRFVLAQGGISFVVAALLSAIVLIGFMVALYRQFASGMLVSALEETVHLVSMIFVIVIGASLFALVFRGLGGDETIARLLSDLPGGAWGGLLVVLVAIFVLGFFLEFLEITYLIVPLVVPVLLVAPFSDGSTIDPLWLGVLIALVLQTSFLTPPFGVALFYLRSVAAASVSTLALYRGVIPFVVLQLLALLLVMAFPSLATWLPANLLGN